MLTLVYNLVCLVCVTCLCHRGNTLCAIVHSEQQNGFINISGNFSRFVKFDIGRFDLVAKRILVSVTCLAFCFYLKLVFLTCLLYAVQCCSFDL